MLSIASASSVVAASSTTPSPSVGQDTFMLYIANSSYKSADGVRKYQTYEQKKADRLVLKGALSGNDDNSGRKACDNTNRSDRENADSLDKSDRQNGDNTDSSGKKKGINVEAGDAEAGDEKKRELLKQKSKKRLMKMRSQRGNLNATVKVMKLANKKSGRERADRSFDVVEDEDEDEIGEKRNKGLTKSYVHATKTTSASYSAPKMDIDMSHGDNLDMRGKPLSYAHQKNSKTDETSSQNLAYTGTSSKGTSFIVADDNAVTLDATSINQRDEAAPGYSIDDSSNVSNLTSDDKPQDLSFSEFKTIALGKINNMQSLHQRSTNRSNRKKSKRTTVPLHVVSSHLRESVDLFGRKSGRDSVLETDSKRSPSLLTKKQQQEKIKKNLLTQSPDTMKKKLERENIKFSLIGQAPIPISNTLTTTNVVVDQAAIPMNKQQTVSSSVQRLVTHDNRSSGENYHTKEKSRIISREDGYYVVD